jgi:hypothetical protein
MSTLPIAIETKICLLCGKQHQDNSAIFIGARLVSETLAKEQEDKMSQPSSYGDCNECKMNKEKGIVLIGFDEAKSDFDLKPSGAGLYRTGQYIVITEEGFKKLPFPKEFIEDGLKRRGMFILEQFAKELISCKNG